jgi:ubiquinone/menaquinone biosynthesis C-methylase UbiE
MGQRPLDPESLRYLRHWEPVLAGPAYRALERIGSEPGVVLDLGAGTGSLTFAAARRWPSARVVALDASGAMLAVARSRRSAQRLDRRRFEWLVADAATMPRGSATVDAVVSSFLLQLVADRLVVLAEVLRVLRPGGAFSFVTWLVDDLVVPADAVYHEILRDLGDEPDDEGGGSPRSGDYLTLAEARDELAEAGFEAIDVVRDELHHAWTAESYLAFKEDFDDHERLHSLEPAERERLHAALVDGLSGLPPDAFEMRGALVAGTARRPTA